MSFSSTLSSIKKTIFCWLCALPLPKPHQCSCCDHEHHHEEGEWRTLLTLSLGCLFFGLLGFFLEKFSPWSGIAIVPYLAAYILGGWDAAIDTWHQLQKKVLDIHFLMLAVALGAASIGAWREGALLLFLFSISGAMEQMAMGKTKKAINALLKGAPKQAHLLEDGVEREILVEELQPGMQLIVRSGEQIPTDMQVLKGESACDESNLTGESIPIEKEKGDTLLSGTLNLWGVLEGKVLRTPSESALQKIIHLIEAAQKMKAPSQRFSDRFGTKYTLLILGLCLVMFFVWWQFFHLTPFFDQPGQPSAFYRVMTLLVVTSPCALVLSVPSAILSAIASGARKGILYRGGAAIETLKEVTFVALDKTGTLTSGDLSLSQLESFEGSEESLKTIAATLANLSDHPLSRAVRKASLEWPKEEMQVEKVKSIGGKGIQASLNGTTYYLGSFSFLQEAGALKGSDFPSNPTDGTPTVWIGGKNLLGRLTFKDELRQEAPQILKKLHQEGVKTAILTGDHRTAAEYIGKKVGVQEIFYELTPAEKLSKIEELKKKYHSHVAMIGDGVNDAPCIAAADVGVAMGFHGSDAALEQAEIVLMNDSLENFLVARQLSKRAHAIIRQNIIVALGTVLIMGVTNFFLPVPLTLGVFAHEGSTLLVVLNSLRLLY